MEAMLQHAHGLKKRSRSVHHSGLQSATACLCNANFPVTARMAIDGIGVDFRVCSNNISLSLWYSYDASNFLIIVQYQFVFLKRETVFFLLDLTLLAVNELCSTYVFDRLQLHLCVRSSPAPLMCSVVSNSTCVFGRLPLFNSLLFWPLFFVTRSHTFYCIVCYFSHLPCGSTRLNRWKFWFKTKRY